MAISFCVGWFKILASTVLPLDGGAHAFKILSATVLPGLIPSGVCSCLTPEHLKHAPPLLMRLLSFAVLPLAEQDSQHFSVLDT